MSEDKPMMMAPGRMTLVCDIPRKEVGRVLMALVRAQTFFLARDQMTGAVHCAETRLSPITEEINEARDLVQSWEARAMRDVYEK